MEGWWKKDETRRKSGWLVANRNAFPLRAIARDDAPRGRAPAINFSRSFIINSMLATLYSTFGTKDGGVGGKIDAFLSIRGRARMHCIEERRGNLLAASDRISSSDERNHQGVSITASRVLVAPFRSLLRAAAGRPRRTYTYETSGISSSNPDAYS